MELTDKWVRDSLEAGYYAGLIDDWLVSHGRPPRWIKWARAKGMDIDRSAILWMQEWALNQGIPESLLVLSPAMQDALSSPEFIEFAREIQRVRMAMAGAPGPAGLVKR